MKIKKVLSLVLVFMLLLSTTSAFAAVPEGTIVFGNVAYDLQALADDSFTSEILGNYRDNNNDFAYKKIGGDWVNSLNNETTPELPATITLKKGDGTTEIITVEEPTGELKVVGVSAINSNQAEVTFSGAVKEVKPANFKVTDKDGNLVFVSKVELNEAKDVATLTFFNKFADKATYSVETSNVADVDGKVMETATEAFTYLAAKVAKVEFTSTTVAPGTNLKTVVKVTDELGRDVTAEQIVEFESSNTTVVPTTGIAGSAGSAIVVAKVGDVKTAPTTIKVAAQTATTFAGSYVHTGAAAADTDAFEKLDADKKVDYVYMEGTGNLSVYYKDQYGKGTLTAVSAFNGVGQPTLTNMTPAIVIVGNDGTITPISAGEGYVKVKNGDVETTIKIVVRAKAAIATMEVEKTDVSVVEGQSATVKVSFKDQFGTKTDATPTVKSEATATATAVAGTNSVVINGVKEGTTTVDVSYKIGDETVKETINVTVVKAADLATYEAVVDASKLDVDGDNDDDTKLPKSTNVVVNKIDANGNKIGTETATLAEVDKDGKAVVAGKELVTISGQNVAASAAGTAYVQVKVGSLVIDTLEFEIVETAAYAKSVDFTSYTLYEKFDDVTGEVEGEDKLEKLIKANLTLKDQYGKDHNSEFTVDYILTNANGLTVVGNKITGIEKDDAIVDIVLTEVKVTDGKNLLESPVVVKLRVKASVTTKAELQSALNNDKQGLIVLDGEFEGFRVERKVTIGGGTITPVKISGEYAGIYVSGSEKVIIEGVTFNADNKNAIVTAGNSNADISVIKCEFRNFNMGVYFNPTTKGEVRDNVFINGNKAVGADTKEEVTITGNTITATDIAIELFDGEAQNIVTINETPETVGDLTNYTVSGNTITK